jgi:hypothetical protein
MSDQATLTSDELVGAARALGIKEFTRADLATKLGVEPSDLKEAFQAAREAGRVERVGEDRNGTRHFRLRDW